MDQQEFQRIQALTSTHWWYQSLKHIAGNLLQDLPPSARILDSGCGTGYLVEALRGRSIFGVDVSSDAAATWSQQTLHRVSRGCILDLPFPDRSFDVVLSLDVVYHRGVDREASALAEYHRVLRPDGRLLLHVPAFELLRSDHDRVVQTRRRFTIGETRKLLREAGFHPTVLSYRNAVAFPAILAKRLLRSTGSSLSALPNWLNASLLRQSRLEWSLIRSGLRPPLGSSIVCLATRSD